MTATYSPTPPWTNGQQVTRTNDGTLFQYSSSDNSLKIVANVAGIDKSANGHMVTNLPLPTAGTDAANKNYVDSHAGGGGIADAPSDGNVYARLNAGWTNVYDGGTY